MNKTFEKLDENKNYITPVGFAALKSELTQLKHRERPQVVNTVAWAAGNGDRSENGDYIYGKKRLREIDRRIAFLSDRINNSVLIDPQTVTFHGIYFGATVTIVDAEGQEKVYTIVGVDEVDVPNGKISWRSPLGAALLYRMDGDMVTYSTPQGKREVEIISFHYNF